MRGAALESLTTQKNRNQTGWGWPLGLRSFFARSTPAGRWGDPDAIVNHLQAQVQSREFHVYIWEHQ